MNKESLNVNDNSNTETLEKQEKSPLSVENKESGQEFAERILNKIKNYMNSFISKKEAMEKIESTISFDDPTIKEQIKSEINLDNQLDVIDNEAQIVQTETSENINSITRDFSKAYHHPEYRNEVAKQIIEARKSGQNAEAIRNSFYDKTASEKENFESQEKERSVAEIMKEKDLVIIHAIPLTSFERRSTPENNPVLKSNGYQDFETSTEIISGLSPTISTSIPSPEKRKNGLYYPSGVILSEGKILATESSDLGTQAHGLYKRISKYGEQKTAIEPDINIDKVIEGGGNYNELTVENPKIAGLFYDLPSEIPLENPFKEKWLKEKYSDETSVERRWREKKNQMEYDQSDRNAESDLYKMKQLSKKMNVPLYIFKNENGEIKKYKVDFLPRKEEDYFDNVIAPQADKLLAEAGGDEKNQNYSNFIDGEYRDAKAVAQKIKKEDYSLIEVTAKDIYESKRDISDEERKKMIDDIKNKGILSDSAEKEVNEKFKI